MHADLIRMLVGRNLKIRYKGSALGFFWSLLTPLAMIVIYALFAGVLGMRRDLLGIGGTAVDYLPFLVSGIVFWQFTSGCLSDSLHAIAGNANLVKKVFFPRVILPSSTVLANAVNFLLTFVVLVLYLALSGNLRPEGLLWLVPALALQLVLCFGLAFWVSTLNVFYRDTEHIVGLLLLAWFFLSPIMYETTLQTKIVAEKLAFLPQGIVYLNPMAGVLALYRHALLGMDLMPARYALDAATGTAAATGEPLSSVWLLLSAGVGLLVLLIGRLVLRSGDRRFGDVL